MPVYDWSQTASSNATADPTIDWAEGQAPSTINDSARAMMAAQAKYRDDIAGAIVTAGTSTAYTVASYSVFDTLAHLNGQVIAFTPHTTNGATVTLSVDGLPAKPLRTAPGTELISGVLIQGTPYVAVYNNVDGAFYLRGFIGNANYGVPIGAGMDYWGPTAPNSSFAFAAGQTLSTTTYAVLYALFNTTYNTGGEPGGTFRMPDKRGRSSASPDNMGGSDATRLTAGALSTVRLNLGGAGGEGAHTLAASEIPTITSSVSASGTFTGTSNNTDVNTGSLPANVQGGGNPVTFPNARQQLGITVSGSVSGSATSNNTSGFAHNVIQPTILCNYIIRVI